MSMGGPIYHLRNPLASDCSPLYDSYDSGYFCDGCRKWHEELVVLLRRSKARLVQIDASMGGFNFANAFIEDDIRDHLDYRKKQPCLKHKWWFGERCELCGWKKSEVKESDRQESPRTLKPKNPTSPDQVDYS